MKLITSAFLTAIMFVSFACSADSHFNQLDEEMNMLIQADRYFNKKKFSQAIPYYEKLIKSYERFNGITRSNGGELFARHLYIIDNLAVCYAITGSPDKAEATDKYGISTDPSYPYFYYSLAILYAEKNDFDTSMAYLQKALANKPNKFIMDKWPDIRVENGFKRFKDQPRFKTFLESNIW